MRKVKDEPPGDEMDQPGPSGSSASGPSTSSFSSVKVKKETKRLIEEDSDEEDAHKIPDSVRDKTGDELKDFSKETFFFARSVRNDHQPGLAVA